MTRLCGGFLQLALARSPNGRFLAVSQPGREPSILIMGTDSAKFLATLEHATLPVWSPDGSQCAFHPDQERLQQPLRGRAPRSNLRAARQFIETGSIAATPGWSNDGQWIFAVVAKSTIDRELRLIVSHPGLEMRGFCSLLAEAGLRTGAVLGLRSTSIGTANVVFSRLTSPAEKTSLGVGVLRDQPHIPKRGHPIDGRLKIGAMAISPDDHYLAIRFGSPGSLSPPARWILRRNSPR